DWDDLLIRLWHSANNSHAIITHYPKGDDLMNSSLALWQTRPNEAYSYHICGTIFESFFICYVFFFFFFGIDFAMIRMNHNEQKGSINRMPRNANGCYTRVRDLSKPILVPFWGGGFAFSESKLLKEVPLDPNTPWIFHGEEFHFASRAWTHGYDFYSPPYDIMFHRYADKAKRGRMQYNVNVAAKRDASEKRINALWGLLTIRTMDLQEQQKANLFELDKYPLGDKRTIQQFWKFVGINPLTFEVTVWKESVWASGGLQRVPWNAPHTDPVLKRVVS
ncbi:hypothetical protein RFI_08941, partial [Reticulomyxa filosa]